MAQNSNQFGITPEKGELSLMQNFNVFNCIVKSDESTALVPGQKVKLVDIAGKTLVVTAAAATDIGFGFIPHNVKKSSYAAGEMVKVAGSDCVMYMEAGAAIAAGALVESTATDQKVITSAGTNKIEGLALDKAAADGDLVRVLIKSPLVAQV